MWYYLDEARAAHEPAEARARRTAGGAVAHRVELELVRRGTRARVTSAGLHPGLSSWHYDWPSRGHARYRALTGTLRTRPRIAKVPNTSTTWLVPAWRPLSGGPRG
jgi:hypothetical protein